MKKLLLLLPVIAIVAIGSAFLLLSCKEDIPTEMSITPSSTPQLNIGDEVTATVTIQADGVKSLKYYKVVDTQRDAGTDVTSQLAQSENTYTYNFTYTVQEFDDLHTLGFEFELTDDENEIKNCRAGSQHKYLSSVDVCKI